MPRSLLASQTRPAYYELGNAFPLADGFLVVALLILVEGRRRVVELVIKVATLVISVGVLRWAWRRHAGLTAPPG